MDVATAVAAWVALALSFVVAGAYGFQLQHYVRFRRPVFIAKEGELPVELENDHTWIGPGNLILDVRGARYPLTLTKQDFWLFTGQPGDSTGMGGGREGPSVTLEPEVWTRLTLEGTRFGFRGDPPPVIYGEAYLSNPRDLYTVTVEFALASDRSKYVLGNLGELRRYLLRTVLRRRQGPWTRVKRLRRHQAR